MLRRLAIACLALCLTVLPVHAAGGTLSNPQTGIAGVYSPQTLISDHPHHVLMGHVIVVTQGGATVRALVIQQRRDGVHRLRYRAAWRGGRELPYRSSYGAGCTHGHCRDNPVGMIFLTPRLYAEARTSGLAARLTGTSGTIDIHAPPEIFTDAATRATEAGFPRIP